jgi:hypothetical protein
MTGFRSTRELLAEVEAEDAAHQAAVNGRDDEAPWPNGPEDYGLAGAEEAHQGNGADGTVSDTELGEWDAGEVDDESIPPRGWLLGNVFCRGFVSSLLGDGAVGKTATRYAQLMSLAVARSLTGEHVFQRSRVLMLSLEDDDTELRRRIRATRLHHGIERHELKGWLILAAPAGARANCWRWTSKDYSSPAASPSGSSA